MPIILLIGGSTGTGKSTVAAEVAHRLGITRVASTDFIRQTMRAFFSPEFMPTIHFSSFEAGQALDEEVTAIRRSSASSTSAATCASGSTRRSAARSPKAGRWCSKACTSCRGCCRPELEGALLVHVVIEIADEDVHRMHFHVRDSATGGVRAMDKYLEQLDAIRRIQTYIVSRARRDGVPVIENANVERTIDQVIELVMQAAERARQTA